MTSRTKFSPLIIFQISANVLNSRPTTRDEFSSVAVERGHILCEVVMTKCKKKELTDQSAA